MYLLKKKDLLKKIRDSVDICRKCELYKSKTNSVPGEGCFNADILFIGEAPGRNEDLKARPFVGRSGKILDELLNSINLTREDVFITNIIKCRPPKNRNPKKNEIEACSIYLEKQIKIINPKIIATLGNFPSSFIFEKNGLEYNKISNIHGKAYKVIKDNQELIIFPIFHPAVAVYNINKKDLLLKDFKVLAYYLQKCQ